VLIAAASSVSGVTPSVFFPWITLAPLGIVRICSLMVPFALPRAAVCRGRILRCTGSFSLAMTTFNPANPLPFLGALAGGVAFPFVDGVAAGAVDGVVFFGAGLAVKFPGMISASATKKILFGASDDMGPFDHSVVVLSKALRPLRSCHDPWGSIRLFSSRQRSGD
jgi:hypothetical protein